MSAQKPKAIVLGGGVAGLSVGLHLLRSGRYDVELFEKNDRIGGLATSFTIGPMIFDFGPHAFHSKEPHVIQFFQDIMKGQYYEIDKHVAIKFRDKLYTYPLNPIHALKNLPISTSINCGLSYLWNLLTNHRSIDAVKTAEEFFVRNYGWELYRIFFEGYTAKVWGIHPRDLSAQFMRNRIPSAGLLQMLRVALTGKDIKVNKTNEVGFKLRIFYPKLGSIQFADAMRLEIERLGGKIHLDARVKALNLQGGRVETIDIEEKGRAERLLCDLAISTIPLPELVRALAPSVPQPILDSAKELKFRPIMIACLWINKPGIFPYQTIYYTNRIFNRLAQMNSYSPETVPPGTSGITAEMSCQDKDPLWSMSDQEIIKRIAADMAAEGLLKESDVKEGMILRHMYGYPIYHLGFERHLRALQQTIHNIPNLYSAGRQGMFNYAQMHFGVSAGMKIADHLRQGGNKPDLGPVSEEMHFI